MIELNPRERILSLLAVIILVPLLSVKFIIIPLYNYQDKQLSSITSIKKKIVQVDLLGQELSYLVRVNKTQRVSLSKRIDQILHSVKLKSKSRTVVEENPSGGYRLILKLDEVNLTELTNLVYRIENSKPVILIDSIDINPSYQNKALFRISSVLSSK